ncbi:MAG: peptide ABC transporter substrate-binding protein [Anaerolineae bacterium]|nr:peptide ABC transporter substrate-binding protein [Anaerolineae bacterium]
MLWGISEFTLALMRSNRKILFAILIALGLFLALACQLSVPPTATPEVLVGDPTETLVPTSTTAPAETRAPPSPTPVPPAGSTATPIPSPTPAGVEPPAGNTLRIWSEDAETLDPALVQDATSHVFVNLLFSGLVALDGNLEVVADLAERWEVDQSGTVYTFYLRDNATFHNGRPVTAEDVRYSIERACDPERGAVQRAQSYLDDIVGVMERTRGETKTISGLRVIDERTIQITIDAPKQYFLSKLTYPTSFVVNRENVEDTSRKWTARPIGTGPFAMVENGISRMTLAAFDGYHRGRPQVDQVVIEYRGDAMNMYERGELDIIEVGAGDIDRVLDPSDPLHADLRVVPLLDVWYIGFNTSIAPFDDRNVRRAFAYATNKTAIAEIAYNKTVVPAAGILPPGMPGYDPDLEGLPYDPDLAAEEIVASRYGDVSELPPIVLTVTGSEMGEMLAEMYNQVLGVEVEVEVVDWGVYLLGLDAQAYAMYSLGWIGDYPDPQNFLDLLFHSESAYNHGAYDNPALDQLVEQARVEQDEEARLALYREAEALLVDDAAWIPLFHSGGYYLVKPYVEDLTITGQGTMNLAEVRIARP